MSEATSGKSFALAEEAFQQNLRALCAELQGSMLPEDTIAEVYAHGFAEDGRTFMLMLETSGGRTLIVSATPGERLRVSVHGESRGGAPCVG